MIILGLAVSIDKTVKRLIPLQRLFIFLIEFRTNLILSLIVLIEVINPKSLFI